MDAQASGGVMYRMQSTEPSNGDPDFTEDDLEDARRMPNKVVTTRPPALGYASIVFIIVNRMVGK